ncbi:histidine kinase [Rhodococcus sp. BP-252]|uniref:histidine kinase n=1 Tax=Rhodococcoides kyotonense TaxID=398843 RepID=A0A177YFV4_9NOCA|nr:histidine kinase [Rhodococcus sp. BP-320]MBY6417732.1 histidine kinase [Rhodococcus sp. BP-321]MBY6423882.1 histidine kinase [Rhodococcus sp. BP-324]MBY6427847.1 histidine kinase [Rhodococcus sp. BP-323]MBY6431846.1 histidine kinase [Rhodococcus sp. BP-322]MBY6441954.1 histidine kinase [Rhodococcus sp. BP-319]MBY6446822.1 histidine kinase [Rhodococcus sp. BP-318]MBY6451620.1 histidine kinase [Rhodococcus sp. BP-315]MBY6456397.1 histidine kinase [Rhodococcus sp. BP-277]MBY6460057.1 histi
MNSAPLWLAVIAACAVAAIALISFRGRRALTTPEERAVHSTLHTASLAARPLRQGLDAESAAEAAPHLRALTGGDALGVADADASLLTWNGPYDELAGPFLEASSRAIEGERRVLLSYPLGPDHAVRAVIAQPLLIEDVGVVGVLGAVTTSVPGPGMLGAISEVARYACGQIELAELDASRARLDRAEVRALRAQISPHFIYNALGTIASFVRTDPDRARELVLEFADFTRYSFRTAGEFTVLADELRNIDRYLTLERARFGDTLQVTLRVAPEVLSVVLPFLALQPLVENAVRHGLAGRSGGGTITIVAADEGTDCLISVEDDGVGMDPDMLRSGSLNVEEGAHVGLSNVDDRLRAAFGNDYGLVVDTAPGAGTKVSMRVPKFRAGIRA